MASGRLIDYLGIGPLSDRPTAPNLAPNVMGLWYSSDIETLSVWDGSAWDDVTTQLDPASTAALALAESAVQPGDNISTLANDAGYVNSLAAAAAAPVQSVFGRAGAVEAAPGDYTFEQIGAKPTTLGGYGITDATPSSHVGSGGASHATASPTVAGFMAAADKAKLDGVAPGATANAGTVTSVAVANATGLSWTGSPITGAGTLIPTLSANLQAWSAIATSTKEPAIAAGPASQYWSGGKMWQSVTYQQLMGTIPTWNQSTTGNAATATKLATPRTINGVPFDGSASIVIGDIAEGGSPIVTPEEVDARADARIELFKETFISLPNAPTADAAGLLGVEFGEMFRNGSTLSVCTSINSMFAGGAPGAVFDMSDTSTRYQDAAGTTPLTAAGQPIGLLRDKSGNNNHASQTTVTRRPLATTVGGQLTAMGDGVDDRLTVTNSVEGDLYWATPYGYMRSQVNGPNLNLPIGAMTKAVIHAPLTPTQKSQLEAYFGVPEQFMVAVSQDTVIGDLQIYSGGAASDITFIGANGTTVTKSLSANTSSSFDVSADGLTAPVAVVFDKSIITNTGLITFRCGNNQFTGSIPSFSANTALTTVYLGGNQLTGSIPSLSANTALTYVSLSGNQLTGSIPSFSANTALTTVYLGSNQLTGSIPSLSANTALREFHCYSNQLTDYAGGTVPNVLGDVLAQNNLLPASAINALLAAFVAAGRTSANGTCILNLGGSGNAAPTGQGLTDKQTLITRGWTVTTN